MMNKSCKMKRILALILAVLALLPAAPALAESYTAITGENGLAVYKDAYLTQPITTLNAYTLVTVRAVKGDVAQLRYGGYTIYANKNNLVAVNDIAIPGVVIQNTRVFEQPDLLSRSAAVKAGTALNVLAIAGEWAMVEKGGNLAYAYVDHLAPAADVDEEESVGDPFLPESEQPSSGSQISGSNTVTIETIAATVNAASLPVYKSASTASAKLGTITLGQEVTVYAYNADWAYIGLNGRFGFCALKGLTKKTAAQPEQTPEQDLSGAIPATVTAASVVVYESADVASKTLGTLQKGTQVNVISTNADWAYIELSGNYGYCALDALTKTSDLTPEDDQNKNDDTVIGDKSPLGSATVTVASAPVYSSMSASAATSHSLKMGETVSFYGYDSNWVLIGKDGKFGFVPRKHLSADSYAELKAEDTGAAVADLESALLSLGYLDGAAGNNFTASTTEAVKRLQTACGMTVTGTADIATLRVLYSGNAPVSPMLSISLSKGSKGDNVSRLQTRLHALGYLSRTSSIDGDYGSNTASAVALFQKAAGATATGTADNATIRALYHAAAPTLPSGSTAADAATTSSGGSSGNTTNISSNLASTTDKYVSGMSNAQKLEYVIYVAQQQLGKKYVFGSAGTKTFDCSGLTMYCFKQVGVSLRHSAYSEGYNSNRQKISSVSSLRRGDLVFFNTMSDGDQCDHVGIYLGSNYFIHASSGAAKVVVSNLGSGYYNRVFSWGRRVLDT